MTTSPTKTLRRPLARGLYRRLLFVLTGAAAALVFYGCDTLTETGETVVLEPPPEVTFRFEFSSDDLTPGETAIVSSVNSIDLTQELDAFGYEKDEVVFAQVSQASLSRLQPSGFRLSSIGGFSVRLVAGSSSATVASQGTLPNATSVELGLGPTTNVQTYVRQPSFSAVAEFVPSNLPADDYILTVTLELRIEIEDL